MTQSSPTPSMLTSERPDKTATPSSADRMDAPAWIAMADRALDRLEPGRRVQGRRLTDQLNAMKQHDHGHDDGQDDHWDDDDQEHGDGAPVTARRDQTSDAVHATRDAEAPRQPASHLGDPTILDWLIAEDLDEDRAEETEPTASRSRITLADSLDADAIAALVAEGDDPWAVDVDTGLYRPEPLIDPRKVLLLARLCATCGDQDGVDRLLGEEAATVLICNNDSEMALLVDVITGGLRAAPLDTGAARPVPPPRPKVLTVTPSASSVTQASDLKRGLDALASPRPLVVLVTDLAHLTGPLAQLPVLTLAPADTDVVLFMLREIQSATGRISEDAVRADLPAATDLAAMPTETLLMGLRARGPIRAARRIAELAGVQPTTSTAGTGPRLEDLPGLGAARTPLRGIVADLQAYSEGRLPWEAVRSGMILAGPTGTGKTTIAAAMARSIGATFITTTLGGWQEGRSRGSYVIEAMAATFAEARAAAAGGRPVILFIDEIDSMESRETAHDHNSSYFRNLLNTLLTHLDGPVSRAGVLVIGATNHPKDLDPALVRPGRLGRMIRIDAPRERDLPEIFRFYLGPDLPGLDLRPLARRAAGMSPAQVMDAVQTARSAARAAKRPLSAADLITVVGDRHPAVPHALRARIAVHEVGHVVAAYVLGTATPVSITLAGAAAQSEVTALPRVRDRRAVTAELIGHLAGRAAEEVILGHASDAAGGGAESDLARATQEAITEALSLGRDSLVWQPATAADPAALFAHHPGLRDRVVRRLNRAYEHAVRVITTNRRAVEEIAALLLSDGHLDRQDLRDMLGYCVDQPRRESDEGDRPDGWWPV